MFGTGIIIAIGCAKALLIDLAVIDLKRDVMTAAILALGGIPELFIYLKLSVGINFGLSFALIKIKYRKQTAITNPPFLELGGYLSPWAAGDNMNLPPAG